MRLAASLLLVVQSVVVQPVAVGRAAVPLTGPWRFHTGDDSHWAERDFDDRAWETVDLTPGAGAHDPDVGLEGYVRGWGARGHAGYAGYAWYRLRLAVAAPPGDTLALAAPLEVDDAYELFVDGRRVAGSGDFSGRTPVAYNTRPLMVVLSDAPTEIAVRVWAAPSTMRAVPTAGGMRIAPVLGQKGVITAHYELEWLKKFTGYVVDAALGVAFLLLAIVALVLLAFDPTESAYRWLVAALVLYAMRRANQAVFFWLPFESAPDFNIVTNILLTPLVLGAWTMTWWRWFRLRAPAWIPAAIGALTALYVIAQAVDNATIVLPLRLGFVALYTLIVVQGVRQRAPQERDRGIAAVSAVSLAIAVFASELSMLHVPGIWFPFGTGVSRTQYALAAFSALLFVLLLRRVLERRPYK